MTPHEGSRRPTQVFTDGACSGNPGPGGWAWATRDGRQGTGGEPNTTNQRMELTAVLEALRALPGPLEIHSDSTYVVNCINDRWYEGWVARGWKNSQRKPVANRDLWEPLIELYLERQDELTFRWVKGHSGNPMNDLVDGLAVAEATAQREAANGSTASPAADGAGAPTGPQPPWPADRAVAVTGTNQPDDEQREGLARAIDSLDPGQDILVSGLRRGVELEGAERAVANQVPLAVVLPYPDPASRWPTRDLDRFERSVEAASWVVTLDGDPGRPSTAVAERDAWIWSAVVGAIVVGAPELVDRLEEAGLGVIAPAP